jgi:hypothetical protein
MVATVVRRLNGHAATGPSGVDGQSNARQRARISPGPLKSGSGWLFRDSGKFRFSLIP